MINTVNGYKSYIGIIIMLFSTLILPHFPSLDQTVATENLETFLNALGGLITVIGVMHKDIKLKKVRK